MLVFQVGPGPQQKSGFDYLGGNPLGLHIERHMQEGGIVEASCGRELQLQCLQLRLELKNHLKFMWQLKAFITPPHVVKGLIVYQWTLWDITFPLLWSIECILTFSFLTSVCQYLLVLLSPELVWCLFYFFLFHSSSSSTPKTCFLFSLKLHHVKWFIGAESLFSLDIRILATTTNFIILQVIVSTGVLQTSIQVSGKDTVKRGVQQQPAPNVSKTLYIALYT